MIAAKHEEPLEIAGYCRDCNAVHSLPSTLAAAHCKQLLHELFIHKRLDFDLPEAASDPELSTGFLYADMGGKMFGILVCEDAYGKEIVLKAFSGKYNDRRTVPGWAPHLFDEARFNAVIAEGNKGIHPLTDRISSLSKGSPEWKNAIEERKLVSHGILEQLYALYEVRNFKREVRSLSGAFRFTKSIPTGTGDCCAPKLLNEAAIRGLKPVSLAEFFLGTPSGTKSEGTFYPPCEDKCGPLLGFMLCGSADIRFF